MPLYGDIEIVEAILRPTTQASMGVDITARLLTIQKAISLNLEDKLGRTFGTPAAATSEVHWIGPYDTLVLNRPARSVTSITYGGTLSGSTMTGGTTTLAADLYNVITDPLTGYIYAIASSTGGMWSWYGDPPYYQTAGKYPVVVTADYADTDDDTDVPADVTYAANILILKTFQIETSGPAGFTGPDGATVPISDPWKHPSVKAVIDKYRISPCLVV